MWVKLRHKIVFGLLRPLFRLFLKWKYGYSTKVYKLEKRPYLIISNHQTTLDPFLLAVSFKRQIYFMASDDLFIKKFVSGIIRFLVAPIPKSKSSHDLQAIKDCIRVVKEGGTISIFPEGNRTYSGSQCYIDPAIVKLAKILKIPLVIYNIHGGYGVEPRWANNLRKGKSYGEVVQILSVEEIEKMSNEDLYQLILERLKVKEAPSLSKYKSKRKAEKLERILYLCPKCHHIGTIYTNKDKNKCHHCDLDVQYTESLSLEGNIEFKTINDWYQYQLQYVYDYQPEEGKTIYEDKDVHLFEIIRCKKIAHKILGTLSMNDTTLKITSNNNEVVFKLSDIRSATVLGKHKLNFYVDNLIYQLKGKEDFNVLKYLQMYQKIKGDKIWY